MLAMSTSAATPAAIIHAFRAGSGSGLRLDAPSLATSRRVARKRATSTSASASPTRIMLVVAAIPVSAPISER